MPFSHSIFIIMDTSSSFLFWKMIHQALYCISTLSFARFKLNANHIQNLNVRYRAVSLFLATMNISSSHQQLAFPIYGLFYHILKRYLQLHCHHYTLWESSVTLPKAGEETSCLVFYHVCCWSFSRIISTGHQRTGTGRLWSKDRIPRTAKFGREDRLWRRNGWETA